MELVAIFALIGTIGLTLANLGCTVYVTIKLYQENGLLHALVGFFCCSLYPFIWGWINAARLRLYDVMIFWTVTSIFLIILQVLVGVMDSSGNTLY